MSDKHVKPQFVLETSIPNLGKGQNCSDYGLLVNNIGYEVTVRGGTIASFVTELFGRGWLNELKVSLHLPCVPKSVGFNPWYSDILKALRSIVDGMVPYENLEDETSDITKAQAMLSAAFDEYSQQLDQHNCTSPFAVSWRLRLEDHAPVEIIIRPTLRESLESLRPMSQFTRYREPVVDAVGDEHVPIIHSELGTALGDD